MNPILKRIISALTTAALVVLAIIYAPTSWLPWAFKALILVAFLEFWLLLKLKLGGGSRLILPGLLGLLVIGGGLSALPATALAAATAGLAR